MASNLSVVRAEGLSFAYGQHTVLHGISTEIRQGERIAIAGPNGSGKTTFVRILSGALRPSRGTVMLDGRPVHDHSPRELARHLAVVAQHVDPTLSFRVRDLVAMGRTPHIGFLSGQGDSDATAVEKALRETDSLPLADRRFSELSGGEQQRVMIAVGLAQETDFLLLDEPTVHLDLQHQHDLLSLLGRLNRERGMGVVAVLHDLNLSALYFERLVVFHDGRVVANGTPADVLTQETVRRVFEAPVRVVPHPTSSLPQVLLDP
jgi:iron complex transport system ATP-binding protein